MAVDTPKDKQEATEDTGSYWEFDDQFEDFEGISMKTENCASCYLFVQVARGGMQLVLEHFLKSSCMNLRKSKAICTTVKQLCRCPA